MLNDLSHAGATGINIHTPFRWIVADETARLALTVSANDVNKLLLQLDSETLWRLADDSPVTWAQLSGVIGGSSAPTITYYMGFTGSITRTATFELQPSYALSDDDSANGIGTRHITIEKRRVGSASQLVYMGRFPQGEATGDTVAHAMYSDATATGSRSFTIASLDLNDMIIIEAEGEWASSPDGLNITFSTPVTEAGSGSGAVLIPDLTIPFPGGFDNWDHGWHMKIEGVVTDDDGTTIGISWRGWITIDVES